MNVKNMLQLLFGQPHIHGRPESIDGLMRLTKGTGCPDYPNKCSLGKK